MKPKKPVGLNGPVRITLGADRSEVEFEAIDFPKAKEEIEEVIVKGFLRDAVANNFLPPVSVAPQQNAQDDFDFLLALEGQKPKELELMEVAPLEHLRGSYAEACPRYKPYDFAEYIKRKILKKAGRYRTSTGSGLLLLVYVTDWKFVLSDSVIRLLQHWMASSSHCFEAIYTYEPIDRLAGVVNVIFPSAPGVGFNPETFRSLEVEDASPVTGYVSDGKGGIEIKFNFEASSLK